MKLLLTNATIFAFIIGANADTFEEKPIFSTDSICVGLAKNFAIGYEYSKKDRAPDEFCKGIVYFNIHKTTMPCRIEDIIKGCEENVKKLNKDKR